MPPETKFDYSFEYFNETIINITKKNIFKSVYVSEAPILYLDIKENINSGIITIKVW